MKLNKSLFFISTALMLLVGCSTIKPISSNTNFPADGGKYKILGRVEIDKKTTKSGYSRLLKEAKKQYPEVDDIINVVIDEHKSSFLFFTTKAHYIMSGIAVDYLD